MELLIYINNFPSTLTITPQYISWPTKTSSYIFPYSDIIGSKAQESLLTILIFNRKTDLFKFYSFTSPSPLTSAESYINSLAATPPYKYAVFLNPISGKKQSPKIFNSLLRHILDYSNSTYELFTITSPSYFETFNTDVLEPYSCIIVLGGDGTMQEILTLLYCKGSLNKFVYGIIPVGSQNALSCELTGKNLNSALLAVTKGVKLTTDLIKATIDDQVFICTTAVCWGFVSDVSEEAQRYRAFGPLRYLITGFLKVFKKWKSFSCLLKTEKKSISGEFLAVLVGNHRAQSFIGNEVVFPFGNINDGCVDVQIINLIGKIQTIELFYDMSKFGAHAKRPEVSYEKSRFIEISSDTHRVFNLDGEIKYGTNAHIEVMPRYITFITI